LGEPCTALLHAAAEVFFEKGYERASLDALIARVGGSKRTLYKAFGSKAGLFDALVTEQVTQALEAGQLKTAVGEVLSLEQARTAHDMLEGKPHRRGKIVLNVAA
jgi:AcrR family transcriptional regulator